MDWLIETIKIGLAAAVATTFDDNIYLTGFFSEVNRTFRPKHVVVGELIGFTALISISLVGFLIGLAISSDWIGLLGILPILIGLNNLRLLIVNKKDDWHWFSLIVVLKTLLDKGLTENTKLKKLFPS
jgi:cadmium resistance protein CadD (predicted permease)